MVITPAGERIAVADELIVRSSVAEYLTFITATGESEVNAVYADENVWLTQKMMAKATTELLRIEASCPLQMTANVFFQFSTLRFCGYMPIRGKTKPTRV